MHRSRKTNMNHLPNSLYSRISSFYEVQLIQHRRRGHSSVERAPSRLAYSPSPAARKQGKLVCQCQRLIILMVHCCMNYISACADDLSLSMGGFCLSLRTANQVVGFLLHAFPPLVEISLTTPEGQKGQKPSSSLFRVPSLFYSIV